MNLVSYMVSNVTSLCVFVKSLFYDKLSQEEARAKWHIEGEASLERRKQYLEQRHQEIKRLLYTTENPTQIYETDMVMV